MTTPRVLSQQQRARVGFFQNGSKKEITKDPPQRSARYLLLLERFFSFFLSLLLERLRFLSFFLNGRSSSLESLSESSVCAYFDFLLRFLLGFFVSHHSVHIESSSSCPAVHSSSELSLSMYFSISRFIFLLSFLNSPLAVFQFFSALTAPQTKIIAKIKH